MLTLLWIQFNFLDLLESTNNQVILLKLQPGTMDSMKMN